MRVEVGRRAALILVGAGLALLALAALVIGFAIRQNDRAFALGRQAAEVREATAEFLTIVVDAETGQRGFLLTGDARLLAPYEAAVAALPALRARLDRLVLDAGQSARVDEIARLEEERLRELAHTIALARAGRREEALASLREDEGRRVMDRLRPLVAALREETGRVLERRRQDHDAANRWQYAALFAAALGVVLIAASQARRTRRLLAALLESGAQLREANADLDRRVHARTEELAATVRRFEVALRAANVIVFTQGRDRRFTWISRGVFGREPEAIVGLADEEVLPPEARGQAICMKEAVLATGEPCEYSYDAPMDGARRRLRVRTEALRDGDGAVCGLVGAAIDVTAEHVAQGKLQAVTDELRATLQRFDVALKASGVIVFSQDRSLRYTWLSQGVRGQPPEAFLGRADGDLLPSDAREPLVALKQRVLDTGEAGRCELRVGRDGDEDWYDLSVEPQRDQEGRIVGLVGAAIDITERRAREAHVRLLMREVTHRSKNLLAVIQAMARQTVAASASAAEFESRFSARLLGLAASHDLLVGEDWHGASMEAVVRSQLAHYADLIGGRIALSGPNLLLKPEAAQNIGMALHELSTNAAKYGALSAPDGRVEIAWELGVDEGERRFRVTWRERGGPQVAAPERRGFGRVVTERIVSRALDGRVALDFAPEGLTWRLDVPASCIAAEEAGRAAA